MFTRPGMFPFVKLVFFLDGSTAQANVQFGISGTQGDMILGSISSSFDHGGLGLG